MKSLVNLKKLLLITSIFVVFFSCKPESELSTPSFSLSGIVKNTTEQNVGAYVELIVSGETNAKYSATANSNGEYQFDNVDEGSYIIVANFQGYDEFSESIDVSSDSQKNITILGSANISGVIINSQTGYGLSNATVSFYVNQSQSSPSIQVTTDSYGSYNINNGPTGNFSGTIEADGFFPRAIENIVFTEGYNEIDPETIVEQPEEGTLRIILSWGEVPYDLDSHLTGPASNGTRFHVYYSNSYYANDVNLDVDDVSSYGPETITISTFYPGMYRYSVHNYSNQNTNGGSGIQTSPAEVEIYDHTGLIQDYTAPYFNGAGNTWRVFEINVSGSTANIVNINEYVQASSSSDVGTFKSANKDDKSKALFDIKDF